MNTEDLTELERAGRRCSVCRSGRGWRKFEVVRADDHDPVVLCASCHARFGDAPPQPEPKPEPKAAAPAAPPATAPAKQSGQRSNANGKEPRADRLRAALRELPSEFSTATAARAAGLNPEKTLARLNDLERRGEVQRIGNRWSTESPPSDLASAMDRLEARTSNLRIIRDRAPVG